MLRRCDEESRLLRLEVGKIGHELEECGKPPIGAKTPTRSRSDAARRQAMTAKILTGASQGRLSFAAVLLFGLRRSPQGWT